MGNTRGVERELREREGLNRLDNDDEWKQVRTQLG